MKTILPILLIFLASCSQSELEHIEPMKEQTENTKAAPTPDITGHWNLLTDDHRATKPIIKVEWLDGVLMLNKSIPLVLVNNDEFHSVDPLLMIQGKMDGNTMTYQELNNQLVVLQYTR